jgi:hypothetical protein
MSLKPIDLEAGVVDIETAPGVLFRDADRVGT